ncbi:MAG TPA: hypothetical protein VLK85_22945 [Ramlibacter sp.]|nr:hypothetical protein [Ramlibacter sp.]
MQTLPTFRPPLLALFLAPTLAWSDAAICSVVAEADIPRLSVEQLKTAYLACDRDSSRGRLDALAFQNCGRIGDALLRKGFAGDFERQLTWWRNAKRARVAGEQAQP